MVDEKLLDDLSRLNNELVNSQRELARKNAELAHLNAVVNCQNTQLEAKVVQRTAVLARQLALSQTLADNAPQVIWTIDGTRKLTFANRAWYDLVGGAPGDWTSSASRAMLTHPDDREAFESNIQRGIAAESKWTGVRRILGKDGSYRTMSYRGSPVLDAHGKPVLWVGIDTDITDLKVAEAALQQALAAQTRATQEADIANRAKSTFLAAMGHEIRTPMNGVLGLLELLGTSQLDSDQRMTLETVQDSGRSLLRIVDDILDFSRMEANQLQLDCRPHSIRQIVRRVAAINSATADMKGVALETHVSTGVSELHQFDPVRVGQILHNLVSNGIKFTERGKVTLRVEFVERSEGVEHLRLVVEDSGIGIAPEDQQRLVQPFMQVRSDTATVPGRSGLGLIICRSLAELMGGTLEMHSTPGRGTTMTASLAFAVAIADGETATPSGGPAAAMQVSWAVPTVAQAQAEGTLLLVVDDHPTNRMVLQRLAGLLGYASEGAANGLLGLNAWKSGRFGAILADCNMPEMDGYEMTRAIRLLEDAGHRLRTPVIACTAGALAAEEVRCIEAGMDDYLVKPVSMATLGEQLSRWLPLPHSRKPLRPH